MKFGRFRIFAHNHGFYRLDGGAMFGTVPKTIWSKLIPADEDNRILMATRSLLIDAGKRVFMVDAGNGDKWSEKQRRIYDFRNFDPRESGIEPDLVTDIVLTHLHFDHCGGLSRFREGHPEETEPVYPKAKIYLQAGNYETARDPNRRERVSYLKDNVAFLDRSKVVLTDGSEEIHPGIWVHRQNGHTRGHQWVEVRSGSDSLVFTGDTVPMSHHLPVPYATGLDICVEKLLREKEKLLGRALARRWILVFPHDPDVVAATVRLDERIHYAVKDVVDL
jgi:glyoxylase-like metal-dependent hydrolase (beta-lactamase superfamily II)